MVEGSSCSGSIATGAVTVILTTHDLADVEHLCKRMMAIDHGRLIYDGGIDEIRRRFGTHRTWWIWSRIRMSAFRTCLRAPSVLAERWSCFARTDRATG